MAAADMDMDMEPSPSTTSPPTPFKRFGIKNSIQTNFGDDYVFQIDSNHDNSTLAVSLSTNSIKLYSPLTGQYIGECNGHSAPINQIAFSHPSSPNVLNSCSSDGSIRAWDIRSFDQVSLWDAGSLQEVFSFSCGGSSDNLLAAGCKNEVLIWDLRKGKMIACLEESHVEDVTQVHFSPDHRNKLISASVDGLICKFDTEGNINDDDHLESVMNVGTSIGKIGFCGSMNNKLWCMTHIETLSIWDWQEGINVANIEDARTLASDNWTLDHVDYFVDCHYSREEDRLYVIGGTNAGSLGYFPINYGQGSRPSIGSPEAVLEGGHIAVVRTVLPMASQGKIFGWTGGEDGRLCCWLSDESCEVNRSWISNGLVIKPPKLIKKSRHQPY